MSSYLRISTGMCTVIVATVAACATAVLVAQGPNQPPDVTIDAATRAEVIAGALDALTTSYVFPDVAQKMVDAIRARHQRKEYDAITSGREFAQRLTEHLREVSGDLHLAVHVTPPGAPPPPPPAPTGALTLDEEVRIVLGRRNFGFERVERLAGNIGYIDMRGFMSPKFAGETAVAAMSFVANCDAVIVDLRQNGGGDPAMVAFITSYFVGPEAVHLNDFYSRPTNDTHASWTAQYVPGKRLLEQDLYILTSSETFSGAEEFTYNLKHLERATVVGETTAGAAHTIQGQRLNDRFAMSLPSGRPINPLTKTNWEGVGIEPHVRVASEHALEAAHWMALQKQQQRLGFDAPWLRSETATALSDLGLSLGALTTSIAAPDGVMAIPASRASDDFESGTLNGWRVHRRGAGNWFTYSNGKTPPDRSRTDRNFPFDVPNPPQGTFAAVSDGAGPGRRILYRDVSLDGRYQLRLTVFYANTGRFSAATATSRNTVSREQHYRIDVLSGDAPIDSAVPGHVLATVFQAQPGDPARRDPGEVVVDLSAWAGETVRLRLIAADNMGPLRAGVDNVRFEPVGR